MEQSRTQWRLKQRCGNQGDILEPFYDVVDDQEADHAVHIQPARPIDDEREYADRDLPRSSSAQSLLSGFAMASSNIHPTYPPRKTMKTAPAIHRDLKPARRKVKAAEQLQPPQRSGPPSRRCPPSPRFPPELPQQLNGLSLQENGRRADHRPTSNASEFNGQSQGFQVNSVRFSVDLEAQHTAERWSTGELEEKEDVVHFQQYQHEWCQTEVELDRRGLVNLETPPNHGGEDWYIGPCSRTDAEHALHLVNKDGAFLVRDCSLNSNSEPFVLSVYHEKKVYNVKIRFIENQRKYALGTGQRSNEMFDSVADIVKFHSIFPIVLISGKSLPGSKCQENCVLMWPVNKEDVDRLLQ